MGIQEGRNYSRKRDHSIERDELEEGRRGKEAMLKGREGKGGESGGHTVPGLKVVEYGSRMGTEVSERELEMTFEMKAVARTSRSL